MPSFVNERASRINPTPPCYTKFIGWAYNAKTLWEVLMILGMTTATFTLVHVLISLLGIASGLVVMYGFFNAKKLDRWTIVFLVTTAATSLTGFAFPNEHITPGIVIGVLSLIVLTIAIVARYGRQLRGWSRPVYVVSAAIALYFNVFVFVVQSFEKVPALHALAPTQKEPPFAVAQLLVLVLFMTATVFALKRFRPNFAGSGNLSPIDAKRAA